MNSPSSAPSSRPPQPSRVTIRTLAKLKQEGKKFSMLTAYDYPTARLMDEAGVDVLLVGDTLAMVVQGHDTTLPVTLDQMIYHAEMVGRAARRAMVVVDLPFPEGQLSVSRTLEAAARILKETTCHAVKLEGGEEQAERITALTQAGMPVIAHVGLKPQNIHVYGGYNVQRDGDRMVRDAQAAEAAGAIAVLIECVPSEITRRIVAALKVPTIGIGAGPATDGQVLVWPDLIGMTEGHIPKFVSQLAQVRQTMIQAAETYHRSVQDGSFPAAKHEFK